MKIKVVNGKALTIAAISAAMASVVSIGGALASDLTDQQLAEIKVRNQTAETVSTTGLTGRTGTSYTTTSDERVRTQGLTGRTGTSYQPALGVGHSSGLTGRTNF
ncbi:hypothetical protein [Ferruginivarius sediminum]|uniref:Uncharacterized protein n=1 Tax=Ferruginivarius sediminum TaxID=2661937 RepID=A0A369TGI4_9PROT|nr:hypothetical protein [Ferruginivarius sediminum]RDD63247.1 hypothetical protein DRB17_02000 [Ferruginivarius sediminum]